MSNLFAIFARWMMLFSLTLASGCGASEPTPLDYAYAISPSVETHPSVEWSGHRFWVELALTQEDQRRGLMYRHHLPEGYGMLFVHDQEQVLSYWMRNMNIAIDIIYFDDAGRVAGVYRSVPPCQRGTRCVSYPSARPARYVLELPAGSVERLGLSESDPLVLSSFTQSQLSIR